MRACRSRESVFFSSVRLSINDSVLFLQGVDADAWIDRECVLRSTSRPSDLDQYRALPMAAIACGRLETSVFPLNVRRECIEVW